MNRGRRTGRFPAILAAAFAAVVLAPAAFADECSELKNAIAQIDRQIADMGSPGPAQGTGRGGGPTGSQVGTMQDARRQYQNAYDAMDCAHGGLNSVSTGRSGQAEPISTGNDALDAAARLLAGDNYGVDGALNAAIAGFGVLDALGANKDRKEEERRRAAAAQAQRERLAREAEGRRLAEADAARTKSERARLEAQKLLAKMADDRARQGAANPFSDTEPARDGYNPFAKEFVADGSKLVAPDETNVQIYMAKPAMDDFKSGGVKGCPGEQAIATYCTAQPSWWKRDVPGKPYSAVTCQTEVKFRVSGSLECKLYYNRELMRSERNVDALADEARRASACTANPSGAQCRGE